VGAFELYMNICLIYGHPLFPTVKDKTLCAGLFILDTFKTV